MGERRIPLEKTERWGGKFSRRFFCSNAPFGATNEICFLTQCVVMAAAEKGFDPENLGCVCPRNKYQHRF